MELAFNSMIQRILFISEEIDGNRTTFQGFSGLTPLKTGLDSKR
jgi:hypothetical protein